MQSNKINILVAASGTGGHLLPALYIVKELEKLNPNISVEFVGSGRYLEEKLIGSKGYKINKIDIVGLNRRGIKGAIEFLLKLPKAIYSTCLVFKTFKPNFVIGVGGYISVLPLLVARLKKIPCLIHEAEKELGLANKFLSYFANFITTAHGDLKIKSEIKVIHTGQPLNPKLFEINYSVRSDKKILLVLGGSLGANSIDQLIIENLELISKNNYEVIHQCRQENIENLKEYYKKQNIKAEVLSFIDNLPELYQQSSLIISRAGANTIRELEIVKRKAILIPLKKAKEQFDNATAFAQLGNAIVINDDAELNNNFKNKFENFISAEVKNISYNITENPATKIARLVLKLYP